MALGTTAALCGACAGGFEPYTPPAEAGVFTTFGDAATGTPETGPPMPRPRGDVAPAPVDPTDAAGPDAAEEPEPPPDAALPTAPPPDAALPTAPPPDAAEAPEPLPDAAPPTAPPPDAAISPCPGGREPERETCNGRDDDCNGVADEGDLCGDDARCEAGDCVTHRWVFEAEAPAMGHNVGFAERGGWACNTADCDRGVMAYGPYTRALDEGTYQARFRLRIDNVLADNGSVVRIEVNDFDGRVPECGQCILAQRDVRRREFPAPMADYDAVLDFEIPAARAGHRLEFRTYYLDIAYVFEDRIEVVRR